MPLYTTCEILIGMKIGIFDSGIGGDAVAADLERHFPKASILSFSDRENLPYGSKTPNQIKQLVDQAIQPILSANCDVVVIACNTATTIALPGLRDKYPDQIFVGIEPMIKPASSLTTSNIICVCATPATLSSARYLQLKREFGMGKTFIEPDCQNWAEMIENNSVNEAIISKQINDVTVAGADIIVLGCTHYHWIKGLIEKIAGNRAKVIEPTDYIAKRIIQVTQQLHL